MHVILIHLKRKNISLLKKKQLEDVTEKKEYVFTQTYDLVLSVSRTLTWGS